MIAEALRYADDPNAPRVEGDAAAPAPAPRAAPAAAASPGAPTIRRVLMTGVSYMIPFVAAGGLLIALSFLLGGYEIVGPVSTDIVTHRTRPDRTCPTRPTSSACDHALFGSPCSPTSARCCSRIGGAPSGSWSRRWPATSPTRSPTGPASPPAS